MSTSMKHARKRVNAKVPRAAFTLIEVLVVVAIIALLVAILLPSLARARDQARMVMCEGHLKELGSAMNMYVLEHKDVLPGPLHPGIFLYSKNINPVQKSFYLPALLRRYFTEKSTSSGSMTDAIASCPAFPIKDKDFNLSIWGVGKNPFHYCVNSWTVSGYFSRGQFKPHHYYFGFTYAGIRDMDDWEIKYGEGKGGDVNYYRPKKINTIRQASKEYAIADAFIRPWWRDEIPGKLLPRGSWPREDEDDFNSGGHKNLRRLPLSPWHMGEGYISGAGVTPRYKGRTVTLNFDMHVEVQQGFSRYTFARDPNQP